MIPTINPVPSAKTKGYLVSQLDALAPQPCPCGTTRRGLIAPDNSVATMHLVDISTAARTHYHKQITEVYLILSGEGFIELDGERLAAKPMMSILIRPGCRHRLMGTFQIINVAIPAFDPQDEWFD